jgi:hypothetical protein
MPRLTLAAVTLAPVLLATAGELLAGCSGGDHITKSQAVGYARAVNLRPGDVPGMSSEGGHEPNGAVVGFEVTPSRGCGASDRGERFDFYSPIFRGSRGERRATARGGYLRLPAEGLHSKIAVMKNAAEQERDFSALGCDLLSEAPRRKAQRLPSPLPGPRVLGLRTWRTAPTYMFGTTNVLIYSDGFRFVMGPAEIKLAVTSAPRPPSAELERRLLSLLYSRAKAHRL